jgi:hypothetical protein
MTTDIEQLVKCLRQEDGGSFAMVNHFEIADELEKLDKLLKFALEGLSSCPHSWGLDITHVRKIQRELSGT